MNLQIAIGNELDRRGLNARKTAAILRGISVKEAFMLRRVTEDYFGWERLLYIAEELGLEPEFRYRATPKKRVPSLAA